MYAIVEISGKQYKVQEGDIVFVDRLESVEEGSKVTFDKVLLVSDDKKVTVYFVSVMTKIIPDT